MMPPRRRRRPRRGPRDARAHRPRAVRPRRDRRAARAARRSRWPLDPDSRRACLVAVTRRDWEKARRVPTELRGRDDEARVGGHGGVGGRARTTTSRASGRGSTARSSSSTATSRASRRPTSRTTRCSTTSSRACAPRRCAGCSSGSGRRCVELLASVAPTRDRSRSWRGPYPARRPARAVARRRPRVRRRRRVLPPRPERPPVLPVVRDAGRAPDDALRRGRPRTATRSSRPCTRSGTGSTSTAATRRSTGRRSRPDAPRRCTSPRAVSGRT